MKKVIFVILFCYFLVLFQTSFLVHFRLFGVIPNLVLILVIVLSFFEKERGWRFLPSNSGVWFALFGGFFLDVFSSAFLGIQIAILLSVSIFTGLVLKKFLRFPKKFNYYK